MASLTELQTLSVAVLPILFAVTVHEVAHGWVAKRLGDPTAQRLGRLTLNPLRHIDPVGTVAVPLLLFLTTGFVFGWAKPVPVTWDNLRHPRRDMALVALAGPGANLLMAVLWAAVERSAQALPAGASWAAVPLYYMGLSGIAVNAVLMVLNLLPVPPLDGGRVVAGLLPGRLSWQFSRIEPFGLLILGMLMLSGLLGRWLWPLVDLVQRVVVRLVGGHS
ncbi:MAG TPA: site-2 protease family protein [Acidiferrobacteraceae bacterium]|nr:site-2 protease family protein [Acidiferrobacteraceae bacterium]